MAGVTDLGFRTVCRELGAGYTVTEMVSAKALCYQDKKSLPLLELGEGEHPAAVQLFGSDPYCMEQAAGIAALDETEYVAQVRELIKTQRPILASGLRALGLRVIEGRANYLLFRAPEALGEALRRKGAVLRSCGNYPGLDASWYRTAVRTENENRQLLALLAETLPEVAQ